MNRKYRALALSFVLTIAIFFVISFAQENTQGNVHTQVRVLDGAIYQHWRATHRHHEYGD